MYRSLRPDTIREEVEMSLERLGVDTIDLYQVHWPAVEPEKTPIQETMSCLMELKDAGKIRAIGVSNVSLDELKEYETHGVVDTNQPRYSLLFRNIEETILPFCIENKISTLAYMPIEQGLLTGKVGMDRTFGEKEWRSNLDWNPWFKLENRKRILDMLASWSDLTDKYNCTLAQLILAWTVSQPGVTHAPLRSSHGRTSPGQRQSGRDRSRSNRYRSHPRKRARAGRTGLIAAFKLPLY